MFPALLTTLLWSYCLIPARRSVAQLGENAANFWRLLVAVISMGALAFIGGIHFGRESLGWFFLSGVVGFGIGDIGIFFALPRIGSRLTILLCHCIAVPVAGLTEWLWLGTGINLSQLAGIGIILGGIVLALFPERTKPPEKNPRYFKGVLFGLLAAFGQGMGAVLSRKAFGLIGTELFDPAAAGTSGYIFLGAASGFIRLTGGILIAGSFWLISRYHAAWRTRPDPDAAADPFQQKLKNTLLCAAAGPLFGIICYQWALATAPGAIVQAIVATSPLVILPLTCRFENDRIGLRAGIGTLAAVAGVAALSFQTIKLSPRFEKQEASVNQPNVIIILTDDQGYGDMSCHGNPWLKTPEMDRLHDDSARLTDFHVDPMCAPSRAALMTGRYSARTGVWSTLKGRYILNRDEKTMAEYFKEAGYKTGLFGKWHLGDSWPYRPFDRGFDESLSFGGGVVGEIPDYWDNDYFDAVYLRNGRPEKFSDTYCTDVWFDEAMRFIGENKHRPFFCYIPANAPHDPFNIHEKYSQPYLKMGLPEKRANFYGMLANLDENLGRLRRKLDELHLAENTILIYFGDNGTSGGVDINWDTGFMTGGYNAGMRGKKMWAFDGGHRNACFIRWPKGEIAGGYDINALTAHLDLLPTLKTLCGLESNGPDLDGQDLTPLLKKQKADHETPRVLCVHNQQRDNPQKGKDYEVITPEWRLAQTTEWGPGKLELFKAKEDPGQENDVSEKYPEVVEQLLAEYDQWWNHISNRFDDVSPIFVGGEQNPVPITCHAWHGEKGLYNQWHVRPGLVDNGYWPINVVKAGAYEIRLHRWPEETSASICAPIPPRKNKPFVDDFVPGEAIPVRTAKIKIGESEQTCPVAETDICAKFTFQLEPGIHRLQTWFIDENGTERGAYYVYITRLD